MKAIRLRDLAPHFVVENTPHVRAIYKIGRSRTLVITFGGIGRDHNVPPPMEFVGTASEEGENHVLAINDLKRSWYSQPEVLLGVRRAVGKVTGAMSPTRLLVVGNSMGAYGAILFSPEIRPDVTVSISPQYSMKLDIVDEKRWGNFRPGFGEQLVDSIGAALEQAPGLTWIVHGMMGPDIRHYALIKPSERVYHGIVPGQGHDIAWYMKEKNVLRDFVQSAFQGRTRRARQAVDPLGTIWRKPGSADDIAIFREMRVRELAERDGRTAPRGM